MLKTITHRLPLILLLLVSVFTLTGCTFFDKNSTTTEKNDNSETEEAAVVQTVTIQVVDQNDNLIETTASLSDGENLYEVLNKSMISTDNLNIEFDTFEFNGEASFFITSINGYDPSVDNKFWVFKVNDQLSTVGISDYMPKADDVVTFELDTIN